MFRKHLACGIALSAVATSLFACAGGPSEDQPSADQDIITGTVQTAFVGSYKDPGQASQDFGSLELKADGHYTAQVLTSVAKLKVLCNHAPCNVGEVGVWSVSHSSDGTDRLRIKPDDDNARIYVLSKPVNMCIVAPCPQPAAGSIRLARGTSNQVLTKQPDQPPATCLAMPSCNDGEVQSETKSGCLQDVPCREVSICGKTIFCSKTD